MKSGNLISDLFCGTAAAGLAVLLTAVAFGGGFAAGCFAAMIAVPVSVLLLKQRERKRRRLRSITALLGYLPAVFLAGRCGVYAWMFTLMNPEYAREYGIGAVGDAFGLIFVYLPAAFGCLACSVLLARMLAERKERSHEHASKL